MPILPIVSIKTWIKYIRQPDWRGEFVTKRTLIAAGRSLVPQEIPEPFKQRLSV